METVAVCKTVVSRRAGSNPVTPTDLMWREAEASCALDGETQSFPICNVYVFRRMPDGKLTATLEYHPDFPPTG